MSRKTAHDFDQELLVLFDAYVHGAIDRRVFLDKAAKFAVGGVTAVMLLDQLSPELRRGAGGRRRRQADQGEAPRVRLAQGLRQGARRTSSSPAAAEKKLPGILVIHENRGLNPHIEDIARRLALEDFVAFAPDALFSAGRLPRRRGQGARAVPEARSGQDPRGLRRRRRVPEGAPGVHGQDRRGGLLLRRRHGELPRHAPGRRPRRRRVLLRLRPGHGGRAEDQGAADGAVGGEG